MLTDSALASFIDDRPDDGIFRIDHAIFDDPKIFDLEMQNIFGRGWVFLGLTSQAPNRNDFFTTTIARTPILVMRDGDGALNAFVNRCPHKGARLAQTSAGNKRVHVCAYHSWSFDSSGRNKMIKGQRAGCYTPGFDEDSHDLARLPAFAEYRGFLFGSLSADIPSLEDYLGGAARSLDLVADQSEEGIELIPGCVTFTYEGNWKLQLENCGDAYHFTSVHSSYIRLLEKRKAESKGSAVASAWDNNRTWSDADEALGAASVKAAEAAKSAESVHGGSFSFAGGHSLIWAKLGVSNALPLFERSKEIEARVGAARRDWMFNLRNLTIFPNLQIAENASSQLRVIRPISANRTEMRTWCFAPKGESAAARNQRIRQYEDFFNPSGLATPDDTVCYENCQHGFASRVQPYLQGYSRGMAATSRGGNAFSDQLGMVPEHSVVGDMQLCDETSYQSYYREWVRRMAGVRG